MKVLWVSNHPKAASGYGSQTRQVGRRIAAAGIDIEFSTNDGSRGDDEWEGLLVRGSGLDVYSRDTVRQDVERSGADWVIVLYDPWVYTEQGRPDPFAGLTNVACWTPIDHFPISPALIPWLAEHRAIAMSQYGYDRLGELSEQLRIDRGRGIADITYIPHAVESVFRPTPVGPGFGRPFREVAGIPDDAFLVGIVAANTGGMHYDRKGWGEMLTAAAPFMERNRDAYLYLHTLPVGHQGIPLPVLIRQAGIDQKRVVWADEYLIKKQAIRDADMASIYTAMDVLLATSRGEGFGLPVIEAQACGVPVIVSNCTAQPELVGDKWTQERPGAYRAPSGWVVATQPDWNPKHGIWFARPDVIQIGLALQDAYVHRGDADMKAAAIARAAEYDADLVFDRYWRPYLADVGGVAERLDRAREKRERRAARNLALVGA